MKIDLSAVLYMQLKDTERRYEKAKAGNEIDDAIKYAQICYNIEKQLEK